MDSAMRAGAAFSGVPGRGVFNVIVGLSSPLTRSSLHRDKLFFRRHGERAGASVHAGNLVVKPE
jgi:hypothetical protein